MDHDYITSAVERLEKRADWYDSPSDFRAGLRIMAEDLVARLDSADESPKKSRSVRAS